jgi:two-component system phosphate regulon response regulator PhoB
MSKIIVVEDNEAILESISSYLRLEDLEVFEFGRLRGVTEAIKMKNPDLIILDIMLPDGDGFQFARKMRTISDVPILFLTAKTSESDRITGFEVGGDDYVIKPFSPRELILRVKSILKRSQRTEREVAEAGVWKFDEHVLKMDGVSHRATIDDSEISLTAAEWKILWLLATNQGMVFTRDRILGECLDYMAEGSERTVDTHIKNLRLKLGIVGWIETVRGYGYRFSGKVR